MTPSNPARVELPDFEPFVGQHCETVATGTLLRAAGVELSEPMMFGLGEGLGFIIINLSTRPCLGRARASFADAADRWTRVAGLIDSCARTGQGAHLREAADHCRHIAAVEVNAMKILAKV